MKLAAIGIRPGIPKIEISRVKTISAHIAAISVLMGIDSQKLPFSLTTSIVKIPPKISMSKTNVCSPLLPVSPKWLVLRYISPKD
jgi:hypothetical protein